MRPPEAVYVHIRSGAYRRLPVRRRMAIMLHIIDSPAGPVVSLLAVILTRTWLFSIAPAYCGHARPCFQVM
jgi:hypothetical protein